MTEKTALPRIVVADDHPEMLDRVVALLRPEFDVVATAHDGISALDCIRRVKPDLVLLDLYMPGTNGLDVVRTLKASGSRIIAVIMSAYNDAELAKAAIAAGAMAFVTKSRLADDLLPALRDAARGCVYVSKSEPIQNEQGLRWNELKEGS